LIGHVEGSLNQGAFSFQGAVDKACRRRLWSNWTKVLIGDTVYFLNTRYQDDMNEYKN